MLSRSLKKLSMHILRIKRDLGPQIMIDAPLLSFLKIKDDVSSSYIVNNLESIAKLHIGLYGFSELSVSSRKDTIHFFLRGNLKVSEMTISLDAFKVYVDL